MLRNIAAMLLVAMVCLASGCAPANMASLGTSYREYYSISYNDPSIGANGADVYRDGSSHTDSFADTLNNLGYAARNWANALGELGSGLYGAQRGLDAMINAWGKRW